MIRPTSYSPIQQPRRAAQVRAGGGEAAPAAIAATTVALGSVQEAQGRLGVFVDRMIKGIGEAFRRLVDRFRKGRQPAPAPAPAPAPQPAKGTYTVKGGDSLYQIAAEVLGDGNRWRELYNLNRDVIGANPNLIKPGMTLRLSGEPAPTPAPKPRPAPPAPPANGGTYTVGSGDTLSGIAQRALGDANRWRELYELNRDVIGPNPNVIQAGMTLRLPGGAAIAPSPAPSGKPVKAPYINQYSPAGAGSGYTNGPANCGPTSMAMIARAFGYGQGMSDAQLINHLGRMGGTGGNGTNVNGIAAMAQGIGKSAQTRGPGANVEWIAEQMRAGKLVVANGDYYAMAPHENPSRSSGHYVAVVGMDGRDFLVHDPADKNVHRVSPEALAKFIRSNPNGGYQIAVG